MKDLDKPEPAPTELSTNAPTVSGYTKLLQGRDGSFVHEIENPRTSTLSTRSNNGSTLASLRFELGSYNGYPLFSGSLELDVLISLGDVISFTGDQITISDPINNFSLGFDREGNFSLGGALSLATKAGKPFQVGVSAAQDGVVETSAGIGYPVIGGVQTSISTEAKVTLQGHLAGYGLSGSAELDTGSGWTQLYRDVERSITNLYRLGYPDGQ